MRSRQLISVIVASLVICVYLSACKSDRENDYGKLDIIIDISTYRNLVAEKPARQLVSLKEQIPDIVLDIRYATTNNFTGTKIYQNPEAYVRKPVAIALTNIQTELNTKGLGLKVFDAYRPYAATVKFYEVYPDTNFVAAPWRGSVHNRGCAVDVTLINLTTGLELQMPTPFDDFSEKASHKNMNVPLHVLQNRKMLHDIMIKHGFEKFESEWWHYSFNNWEEYKLMDIAIKDLQQIK